MKLEINNTAIDFELEQEKSLGEVVLGVIDYLKQNGFTLFHAYIDGVELNLQDEGWHQHTLDNIELLQITAKVIYEIEHCHKALVLTIEAIQSQSIASLEQMEQIWPEIVSSVGFWLSDFHLGKDYMQVFEKMPKLFSQVGDENVRLQLQRSIDLAAQALTQKNQELDQPWQQAQQALESIKGFRDELTQLSVLFQNQQDAKAMHKILAFMETFQKLMRCVSFIKHKNQPTMQQQLLDIAHQLSQQMTAFSQACEQKDYVLAADLAEYEILPILESLDSIEHVLIQEAQ